MFIFAFIMGNITIKNYVISGGGANDITIDFSVDNSTPDLYETINFTSVSPDVITNYYWEFGDGTISTLANPSKSYTSIGFFNVQLTVSNSSSECGVVIKNNFIEVNDLPYNAQTNLIIASIYANGGFVTPVRRVLMNQLVEDLLGIGTTGATNVYADLAQLRIFAAEEIVSAKTDWVLAYALTSVVNGVSFIADRGFDTTGTTSINGYLNNFFNPSTNGIVLVNNMFIGYYFNRQVSTGLFTGCNDGTNFVGGVLDSVGTTFTRFNSLAAPTATAAFTNTGFIGLYRNNALSINRILNGVLSAPILLNSSAKPNASVITFGVGTTSGVVSTGHNSRCAVFVAGRVTDTLQLYNSLFNYLLAIGAS